MVLSQYGLGKLYGSFHKSITTTVNKFLQLHVLPMEQNNTSFFWLFF